MAFISRRLGQNEPFRPRSLPPSEVPNLLGTTLVPAAAPPVNVPRAPLFIKIVAVSSLVALLAQPAPALLQTTLGQVPTPFVQSEWPNPPGPRFATELRTWLGILSYLGLDTFYGEPGEVRPYHWPNPIRPALFRPDASQGRIPPPVVAAAPFTQGDWPNPTRPITGPTPRVYRPDTQPSVAAPPIAPLDWPNPLQAARFRPDISLGRIPSSIPQPPPFFLTDWPNPAKPSPRLDWIRGTTPQQFEKSAAPLLSVDWPNPWRPAIFRLDTSQGRIPPAIAQAPFALTDWPNPRPARAGADWWQATPQQLFASVPPFRPLDYPNPIGPRRFPDYIASTPDTLLIIPPTPLIRQVDWPNPTLRVPTRQDWLFPPTIYMPLTVVVGGSWTAPNPRGAPPVPQDWLFRPTLYMPLTVPAGSVWTPPNPRGAPPVPQDWIFRPTLYMPLTVPAGSIWTLPNPRGAPPPPQDWIFRPTVYMPLTVVVGQRAIAPNPLIPGRVPADWFVGATRFIPSAGTPFHLTEWPNPLRRRLEPGWIAWTIPPAPPTPFHQVIWPNPGRRSFPIVLRTSTGLFVAHPFLQGFSDLITLTDILQVASQTHGPQTSPTWRNPPRLAETLWVVAGTNCPCGLGHVGPQGCNAVTGVSLEETLTLSDSLTATVIPGETAVFATGFEEGQAAGEALSPGARSALFSQKSPNFDGMPYIVSDFTHSGSYSWQVNQAHCQRGMLKSFSPTLSPPYSFSFKTYLYVIGLPAGNTASGLIDFYYASGVVLETCPVLVGGTMRIGLQTNALTSGSSQVNSTGVLSLNQWYRVVGFATVAADGITWSQTVTVYVGDTMTVAATASHSGTNYNGSAVTGFGIGDISDLDGSIDFRIDDLVVSNTGTLTNAPYAYAIATPNTDISTQWSRLGSPAAASNALNVGDFPGTLANPLGRFNHATTTGQVDRFGLNVTAVPDKTIRRAYVYVYNQVLSTGPLTVRAWNESGTAIDGPVHTDDDAGAQLTSQMLPIFPGTKAILSQYNVGYVASGGIVVGGEPRVEHQWVNVEYDPTS